MKPVVWTVTLSWNGKDDTLKFLETLYKQTVMPDKIIVIDNGSSDHLQKPLQAAYPDVHYIALEKNIGFSGGMNLGMQQAIDGGADYVFIPSNDTLLHARCLENLIQAMIRHPDAGAVAPKIFMHQPQNHIYFNGGYFSKATLNPIHPGANQKDKDPNNTEIRQSTFINGCAPLYRVAALVETGLFDQKFTAYFEDADLSLRLLKKNYSLFLVPQATLIHRHGVAYQKNATVKFKGTTSPAKWFLMTRNRLWLLRKHGSNWQKLLGYCFIVMTRIIISSLMLALGRFNKGQAVFKGLWDGLFCKIECS